MKKKTPVSSAEKPIEEIQEAARMQAAGLNKEAAGLLAREKYDQAIQVYKKVIVIQPDSADAWNNLAVAQLMGGRDEEAWQSIGLARKIEPTHLQSLKTWLQLTIILGRDRDIADVMLDQLLRDYPSDPDLLWMHGRNLVDAGQEEEASVVFKRILSANPDYVLAEMSLRDLHA